jgi:hypothetical protein
MKGSALVIAILLVALAGVVATALAELGRLALARARIDRDGLRAWFVAEGGLTDTVAAIPPGRRFDAQLRDAPAPPPATGPPWSYGVGFLDDGDDAPSDPLADVNARVMLRVTAFGPTPVRRRLEAVIARRIDPVLPGAATLGGEIASLTPDFSLDGRDFDVGSGCTMESGTRARAGLSLPEGSGMPLLASPEQIRGWGASPSIAHGPTPDLTEVANDPGAARLSGGSLPGTLGDLAAPGFTIVAGDALADGSVAGAGTLYVTGRLRVSGHLDFRGLVAAAGGVEVVAGGRLDVCGGLWATGTPALDARGTGHVRASSAALRLAATVAPLPAAARVVATREAS